MREDSEPGRAVWPDAYAGDLAPFFGEIVGIPETLGHYRVHGKNSQLRFDAEKQLRQIEFEHHQVREALARLGRPDTVAPIDHHLAYLESACGRRPGVSVGRVLSAIVTYPGLSAAGRLHAALRVSRDALARARGGRRRGRSEEPHRSRPRAASPTTSSSVSTSTAPPAQSTATTSAVRSRRPAP